MKVVHDISRQNLADVPTRLRILADSIERGDEAVRACICLVEYEERGLTFPAFGRDADQLRVIGLLAMAQAELTREAMDRTNPRLPEPAA